MENITFNPENVKILGYKMVLEHIQSPVDFDTELIYYHGFHVDMELNIDPEDDLLKVDLRFEVITDSEGNNMEEAQAVFQLIYYLRVIDLDAHTILREEERIVLHQELGNFIAALTYSTSRGIILGRVPGTGIKDFILPVMNTDSLLNGNQNN
jgi:hypothetical protein